MQTKGQRGGGGTKGMSFSHSADGVMLQMTVPSASMTISRVDMMLALTCTKARCPFLRRHYIPVRICLPSPHWRPLKSGATLARMTGECYWHSVRIKNFCPVNSSRASYWSRN